MMRFTRAILLPVVRTKLIILTHVFDDHSSRRFDRPCTSRRSNSYFGTGRWRTTRARGEIR